MKAIGFFSNHDPEIACSQEMSAVETNDQSDNGSVIDYLSNQGRAIIKLMSTLYDDDGTRIGAHTIFSDGTWIWPGYYTYYVHRYNLDIPDAFRIHVKEQHNKKPENMHIDEARYCEYVICKLLKVDISKVHPDDAVKSLIIQRGTDIECIW